MIEPNGLRCLHQQIIRELGTTVLPTLPFQVTEDLPTSAIHAQKARSEAKALVLKPEQQAVNERSISLRWPAHGIPHAHDTRGELPTLQLNLCQWFSLWLYFHCLVSSRTLLCAARIDGYAFPKEEKVPICCKYRVFM